MSKCRYIVVHCSDTPDDRRVTAGDVHRWHKEAPRYWDGIGYHFFIRRDGSRETGRPVFANGDFWPGAHVKGHNDESIGICLAGQERFTPRQYRSLAEIIKALLTIHPDAQVVGHYELDQTTTSVNNKRVKKTCPNFDVRAWWSIENAN